MIILVKVNRSYIRGMDPKHAAYRSWGCTRLLDDPTFRNQYKYLVAYYKKEIVGTFCIHGVSIDNQGIGRNRKVKFLLKETDNKCDEQIKQIVDSLILAGSRKILGAISFCYIDINLLNQANVDLSKLDCTCDIEEIPILDSHKISYSEKQGD